MDAAVRERAAQKIAELSREQVAWVLAFMAGMEAEHRLLREEGREKTAGIKICSQTVDFSSAK